MARARRRLAPDKVRLVQVARKRLDLAEADYRSLLMQCGGVTSSRDLSGEGFRELMDAFAAMGFQSTSNKANFGRRPGFATAGHVVLIRRLWAEYWAGRDQGRELRGWLERNWGVSDIRFLGVDMAPKVITALRAMVARRQPSSDGGVSRPSAALPRRAQPLCHTCAVPS